MLSLTATKIIFSEPINVKIGGLWSFLKLVCVGTSLAQEATPAARVIERGPHHNRIEAVGQTLDAAGQGALVTNRYVELATGLNRWDSATQNWVLAQATWKATPDGYFAARQTAHHVVLAPNLRSQGAVDLLTPDGVRLRSTVWGLALRDTASGQEWLLAETQDCAPTRVSATEVVYADAFDGLRADVRYTLGLNRFEQDVILREPIPAELLKELGIAPATAELVVLTEFFDPPAPGRETRSVVRAASGALADERLVFGAMSLEAGHAFAVPEKSPAKPATAADDFAREAGAVRVFKRWAEREGRPFLIETVPYPDLAPLLAQLPVPGQARAGALKSRLRRVASLPEPRRAVREAREARAEAPRQSLLVGRDSVAPSLPAPAGRSLAAGVNPAASASSVSGVVLDYALLASQADFTFRADTTYSVTGQVDLTGTTTLEGGAVVKFPPANTAARIYVRGPLVCATGPYRPAIFTARDDNSVGEPLPGSTGVPSGLYGGYALYCYDTQSAVDVRHVRIDYLAAGVGFYANASNRLRHAQIAGVLYPVYANNAGPVTLENVLVSQVGAGGRVIQNVGTPATVTATHLTVDTAPALSTWTLTLRNSLLAGLATPGGYTGDHNAELASGEGAFASAGAGSHYLALGSPHRNAGAEDLAADLLAELRAMTTEPPAVWGAPVTANTLWEPWIERDTDTPDLGYHYPPLDYLCADLTVTDAGLTLTNGVAVGVYGGAGWRLAGASQLVSEGAPTAPNRIVRAVTVQEQTPAGWTAASSDTLLTDDVTATASSAARLRFTELVVPGGQGQHFSGGAKLGTLVLTDCELTGGRLAFDAAGAWARVVALTNNVFERVNFSLGTGSDTTLTAYARNNLFRACATVNLNAASANAWEWRDNLLDATTLWQYYGGVANGNNAYRSCARQLTPAGGGNLTLTTLSYTADAWGRRWYATAAPGLVDAGSRSASAAGLYHHTTQTSQAQEAATPVDVGFHYIPLDPETGAALDATTMGCPITSRTPTATGW